MFKPRPMQAAILRYRKGKMGVSAVPGSGKTHTLSYLAARLIASGLVDDRQEVLIVTLVNSAVNNFASRISGFVRGFGLLPDMGYRVRTLHGLAHDIVRERPDLVGLSDRFQILDERESDEIMKQMVATWLRVNPQFMADWMKADLDTKNKDHSVLQKWEEAVISTARAFIRQAKDLQLGPAEIKVRMEAAGCDASLLRMGCEVYADYQRALNYRSTVDFDDLIRLALQALTTDPGYLERLRHRWPFILEDEAQDSSSLQQQILRLLAGENGNWVRVGDPNQAIFETFTTASPRFLRSFLTEPGVVSRDLANSGRSSYSIIRLANHLIDWTEQAHPQVELRDSLTRPYIQPTAPDDPQPNPPDQPDKIRLMLNKYEPEREIELVVKSAKTWVAENPHLTAAVLVPRNERGAKIVEGLKAAGVPHVELLQSSLSTRQTAKILSSVLAMLADPSRPNRLSECYEQVRTAELAENEPQDRIKAGAGLLKRCVHPEDYLAPRAGQDWLAAQAAAGVDVTLLDELAEFRLLVQRWQAASLLPVDQLILTVSQEIFHTPADLALGHKLALVLERAAQVHPEWTLHEFTGELNMVVTNERKLSGFSEEDIGFNPDDHPGKVAVVTMHKAKGLEWDKVYLISVNNYDFPSAEPYDTFISEKWFIRNSLNLEAEALARLKALASGNLVDLFMEEGVATQQARLEYASERLRLLYVGITRARRELVVTWNTGRKGESRPAVALIALAGYWEKEGYAAAR